MADTKERPDISLRLLSSEDADLATIANELNAADSELSLKSFSAVSLRTFLADPNNFYLIAYIDNVIVGAVHGYLHLHPAGARYLYIDEVDTFAGYRRNGVAGVMMRNVFELAQNQGAEEVWLGTEHDNEPAKALYNSLVPTEIENGPIYIWKIPRK